MSVVTLEIFSEDALKLLQQLEVMQILKVIKSDNSQPYPNHIPEKVASQVLSLKRFFAPSNQSPIGTTRMVADGFNRWYTMQLAPPAPTVETVGYHASRSYGTQK
jgi:hypothetical protein